MRWSEENPGRHCITVLLVQSNHDAWHLGPADKRKGTQRKVHRQTHDERDHILFSQVSKNGQNE